MPAVEKLFWFDDEGALRPGDVVRMKSGRLRTILQVSYQGPNGYGPVRIRSLVFPILHCSWTERGYTIYYRTQLIAALDCKTRARVNLMHYEAARRILKEQYGQASRYEITCCEVVGVFT
jgi:hypothetical protein